MAPLPGWVFMLAGVAVASYSTYIEARSDKVLTLFFWTGILFVGYGFLKELFQRLGKKKPQQEEHAEPPKKDETQHDHRHPAGHTYHGRSHHETHKHVRSNKPHSHPHNPQHKGCPQCHTTNHANAKFCHYCGQQF